MSNQTELAANNADLEALLEQALAMPTTNEVLAQANEYTETYVAENAAPAVYEYDAVNGDVCNTYVTDTKIFVMNGVIGPNANQHGFLDVKRYNGVGFVPIAGLGFTNPVVHQKFTEYQNSWTAHRWSIDGGISWSEWEYDNPPMHEGIEYRTTQRWMGRPVYTKLINLGTLSANKDVPITPCSVTPYVFNIIGSVAGRVAPIGNLGEDWSLWINYNDSVIRVRVGSAMAAVNYTGRAQIWYVEAF